MTPRTSATATGVLRFGFGVNPHGVAEVAGAAGWAEEHGFDRVGVWDSPVAHREVWVTLAAVAAATERLRIGPWVTNAASRHPVVTASAAATLDELAPGRVLLGVGSGDSGVYNLGSKSLRLDDLERFVTAVRNLLTDGTTTWRGHDLRLEWPGWRRVPIFVSAHGPRALRMAGRVADGVIVATGVRPDDVTWAREQIAIGCREAGRDLDELELVWMAPWYLAADREDARREALWHLASLVHHWARSGKADHLPERYRAGTLELGSRYDLRSHGAVSDEQKSDYAAEAGRLGVADYLVDRFTFSGTAEEVGDRMSAAAAAGAIAFDCANSAPPGHVLDRPSAFADGVLPLLRPARKEA